MKISTKGRYGLRALIDIGLYSSSDIIKLKTISERQNISERYLEQIFSSLRKAGIVNAKKGAQGGYFLAEDPREITIGKVLRVLEGDLLLIDIESPDNDLEEFICNDLWSEANKKICDYFDSITLEDMINRYKSSKVESMYYI